MKYLAVFAAIAALAAGNPVSWTLKELSEALKNPNLEPALVPYLENAFNDLMLALINGHEMEYVIVNMPHVGKYTKEQLVKVIQDPNTDPAVLPFYKQAFEDIMHDFYSGIDREYAVVVIPANVFTPEPVDPKPPSPVVVEDSESTPSVASSPLVQIIVNVQGQTQGAAIAPADSYEHPISEDARN